MSKKAMKDTEIETLLGEAIQTARNYDSTEVHEKRRKALDYVFGDMTEDVPAREGHSRVVTREMATVVGWMIPGIIKTFTASGRMVDFEPEYEEDEAYIDQCSDAINHAFIKECDGYKIMYNAIWDALVMGDGIVKTVWDHEPEYKTSMHTDLSDEAMALLLQDPEIEVLAHSEEVKIDENTGEPYPCNDLKVRRKTRKGKLSFSVVAPENFLMDKEHDTIEESRFKAERHLYTRSELVEMGHKKSVVDMLPTDRTTVYRSDEEIARDEDRIRLSESAHDSVSMIEVYECYMEVDVDGDGVAETIRALYAGNDGEGTLLEWDVWDDESAYTQIPCDPIPHRFDSNSVYDWTADLQRVNTVLWRQLMDNVYANNNPQPVFEHGAVVNPEAITNPKPGQPIILKKGSQPIDWFNTPFVADKIMAAIQSVHQELERRTGISRESMALDPDALQNVTATASQNQQDARQSKIELVARNMAEMGWRKVFRKALRLTVKHQDKPFTIRLKGEWVPVDPRHWNANMDCTVNTGLGTGSRERDVAALTNIFGLQDKLQTDLAEAGFMDSAIDYLPKMNKTAVKIAENTGLRNADDFFLRMDQKMVQQIKQEQAQNEQQPSEVQQKAQAEIQIEKARIEAETQRFMAEHQGKMALERAKLDQVTHREKSQMEADIAVKTHEADLMAAHQANELAARREKELRDYELGKEKNEIEWAKLGVQKDTAAANATIQAAQVEQQAVTEDKRIAAQKEIANAKQPDQGGSPKEGSGKASE